MVSSPVAVTWLQAAFVIYANPESNLKEVKKPNKDNADASYTVKYQGHLACNYGYKVVCIDERFSKQVQIYQSENAVYRFIKKMFEEVGYCKEFIKINFNTELTMKMKNILENLINITYILNCTLYTEND